MQPVWPAPGSLALGRRKRSGSPASPPEGRTQVDGSPRQEQGPRPGWAPSTGKHDDPRHPWSGGAARWKRSPARAGLDRASRLAAGRAPERRFGNRLGQRARPRPSAGRCRCTSTPPSPGRRASGQMRSPGDQGRYPRRSTVHQRRRGQRADHRGLAARRMSRAPPRGTASAITAADRPPSRRRSGPDGAGCRHGYACPRSPTAPRTGAWRSPPLRAEPGNPTGR